jgi:hypothetical protein
MLCGLHTLRKSEETLHEITVKWETRAWENNLNVRFEISGFFSVFFHNYLKP